MIIRVALEDVRAKLDNLDQYIVTLLIAVIMTYFVRYEYNGDPQCHGVEEVLQLSASDSQVGAL